MARVTNAHMLARVLTIAVLYSLSLAACGPSVPGDEGELPGPGAQPPPADTTDSDGDGISDSDEGKGQNRDSDGDGTPDYLDPDSDGDCIPDSAEAGDADVATPPTDSDNDGIIDAADVDADNDGVADGDEDSNCSGTIDAGETSPFDPDSDGDGASDLVESVAGTDPVDSTDNPQANGDFVFEVPYQEPPSPLEDRLDFGTDLSKADVVFAMDTTGSMGGEITALKSSLSALASSIGSTIENVGFAVVGYDDFPSVSGGYLDQPFYLLHRIMTAATPAGLASIQSAVNQLTTHGGGDLAESGYEMLYQVVTGAGTSILGASVPPFSAATAPPTTLPAGEQVGSIGGVGFRPGSLPIVVWITDAPSHDSASLGRTSSEAMTQLAAISAKVIGVISSEALTNGGLASVQTVVSGTGAQVPPTAWGPVGTRPAGCSIGQCCTGQNGAGKTPVGGQCSLLFEISGTGTGLGDAVAKAVEVLADYGIFDLTAEGRDDPSDSVDAVASFVARIEAEPSGGAPCTPGLTAVDGNSDGYLDTFQDVGGGGKVCFDVVPKTNTTVPATGTAQLYMADVVVIGDGITDLDTRRVFFIVPPELCAGCTVD